MNETPITITLHLATLAGVVGLLGVALREHGVWVRMKERLNTLWAKDCKSTGAPYEPVEGGK
jgi:hypothetical protein